MRSMSNYVRALAATIVMTAAIIFSSTGNAATRPGLTHNTLSLPAWLEIDDISVSRSDLYLQEELQGDWLVVSGDSDEPGSIIRLISRPDVAAHTGVLASPNGDALIVQLRTLGLDRIVHPEYYGYVGLLTFFDPPDPGAMVTIPVLQFIDPDGDFMTITIPEFRGDRSRDAFNELLEEQLDVFYTEEGALTGASGSGVDAASLTRLLFDPLFGEWLVAPPDSEMILFRASDDHPLQTALTSSLPRLDAFVGSLDRLALFGNSLQLNPPRSGDCGSRAAIERDVFRCFEEQGLVPEDQLGIILSAYGDDSHDEIQAIVQAYVNGYAESEQERTASSAAFSLWRPILLSSQPLLVMQTIPVMHSMFPDQRLSGQLSLRAIFQNNSLPPLSRSEAYLDLISRMPDINHPNESGDAREITRAMSRALATTARFLAANTEIDVDAWLEAEVDQRLGQGNFTPPSQFELLGIHYCSSLSRADNPAPESGEFLQTHEAEVDAFLASIDDLRDAALAARTVSLVVGCLADVNPWIAARLIGMRFNDVSSEYSLIVDLRSILDRILHAAAKSGENVLALTREQLAASDFQIWLDEQPAWVVENFELQVAMGWAERIADNGVLDMSAIDHAVAHSSVDMRVATVLVHQLDALTIRGYAEVADRLLSHERLRQYRSLPAVRAAAARAWIAIGDWHAAWGAIETFQVYDFHRAPLHIRYRMAGGPEID